MAQDSTSLTPEAAILAMRQDFLDQGWPGREAELRACVMSLAGAVSALANVAEGALSPAERARQIDHAKRAAGAAVSVALGILPHGT
jgi:hypothetical protein